MDKYIALFSDFMNGDKLNGAFASAETLKEIKEEIENLRLFDIDPHQKVVIYQLVEKV